MSARKLLPGATRRIREADFIRLCGRIAEIGRIEAAAHVEIEDEMVREEALEPVGIERNKIVARVSALDGIPTTAAALRAAAVAALAEAAPEPDGSLAPTDFATWLAWRVIEAMAAPAKSPA